MSALKGALVVAGLLVGPTASAQTVHPWGTSRCPPPTDTLSLLQSRDSAYAEAPAFIRFLQSLDIPVRCVTRSTLILLRPRRALTTRDSARTFARVKGIPIPSLTLQCSCTT
jgi:hypothetical protein